MASTLTVKLSDATTVTWTMAATDLVVAKATAQQIPSNGGFFDDVGVFHPATAVVSVTIA